MFLGLHRGFGDTFADQFESVFAYLKETLAGLGLMTENLVKINVWLKAINDLPEMEKRFHGHFAPDHFPARMTATTQLLTPTVCSCSMVWPISPTREQPCRKPQLLACNGESGKERNPCSQKQNVTHR